MHLMLVWKLRCLCCTCFTSISPMLLHSLVSSSVSLFHQPSTSRSTVYSLRYRYRYSSHAYLYTRTKAMTSPESHALRDMANREPSRASSPTMSTSPARSTSSAVDTRVLAPSPTISNLDLDEELKASDINPLEALVESTSNPQEATAESISEPHEVLNTSTSATIESGDISTLDSHQSPAMSTSEPHRSPTESLHRPPNSRAVSALEAHEFPEQSASKPPNSPRTCNLESPKSIPKSASEPDSDPGSDESPSNSTSEPDLTPMTSNRESRKSSKLSMPGSYMSSNVDMSDPEESHQSLADSAEASEQSPSPAKTPPPPPPEGSYAAVDRDLLYTVCSLTALSTAYDSYSDWKVVLRQWPGQEGTSVEIRCTPNACCGCFWLGNRCRAYRQNNVHVSSCSSSQAISASGHVD